MRSCIIPLFLLLICQNFTPSTSIRGPRRARSNKGEHFRGPPSTGEHDKGELSKTGASKGDSSDEEPGPSKKQKTCDKTVCGKCEEDECVCWRTEGNLSNHTQNSYSIWKYDCVLIYMSPYVNFSLRPTRDYFKCRYFNPFMAPRAIFGKCSFQRSLPKHV